MSASRQPGLAAAAPVPIRARTPTRSTTAPATSTPMLAPRNLQTALTPAKSSAKPKNGTSVHGEQTRARGLQLCIERINPASP